MTRQRSYASEYAARTERAQAMGFSGYGQQRRALREIQAEVTDLRRREIWPGPELKRGDPVHELMLQAKAIIFGYDPRTVRRAAENRESLLGRTAKGRALREKLRQAFGWKSGEGWGAVYFPIMRGLY